MDKILEFLRAYFGNVLKIPEQEITALFNADSFDPQAALTAITEKDKARVSQFSGKFQEGINKGKADALKSLETELAKKYSFAIDPENPLQALDLVEAIVTKEKETTTPADVSKLTADDIKKLPAFQTIKREHTKELTTVKTEAENRVKEIETATKKEKIFSNVVTPKALEILTSLNPVLPQNAKVAEKQKSSFLSEFKQYDWTDQDGAIIAIDKDGNVVKDEHGNAINIEDFSKSKSAEWFEFKQNNGGGNANNGKPGEGGSSSGGGNYPATINKPKTFDEYSKIIQDQSIPLKDRQTVRQVWEEEQAQGAKA